MNDPVCLFPSVSSALLPHAAAEETGSSRRGHSGEGWLDKPPPLTFLFEPALPPHRPHLPYFISTSSLAPSAITSSLHGTGRAAQMTTCLARAVASDNQESVIPGFVSIRVVILETCLQFQCCLSSRRKPDESFVRPPVLLHLYCFEKYEPKRCTHLPEGENSKRLPGKWETLENDCKLSLLSRPQLTQLAVFSVFYTTCGCNKIRF